MRVGAEAPRGEMGRSVARRRCRVSMSGINGSKSCVMGDGARALRAAREARERRWGGAKTLSTSDWKRGVALAKILAVCESEGPL